MAGTAGTVISGFALRTPELVDLIIDDGGFSGGGNWAAAGISGTGGGALGGFDGPVGFNFITDDCRSAAFASTGDSVGQLEAAFTGVFAARSWPEALLGSTSAGGGNAGRGDLSNADSASHASST